MDSYNAGIIGQYEKTFNSLLVRYNGSAIGNRDNFETIDVCDFDYGTSAQLGMIIQFVL